MKKLLFLTIVFLPLFAQDFLEGVKAEDLMLERIEPAPMDIIEEIECRGVDYWGTPTFYTTCSPDSMLIAEVRTDKPGGKAIGVWLVNRKTKIEKQIDEGIIYNLMWSYNGKFLVYEKMIPRKELYRGEQVVYQDGGRWIYSLEKDNVKHILISDYHVWAPLGNFLAGTQHYKDSLILVTYDAEKETLQIIDKTLFFEPWNLSWSPDGEMLAYVIATESSGHIERSPVKSEVFIINRDGSGKTQITYTLQAEIRVKWLSDKKSIVVERFKEIPALETGGGEREIVILKLKSKREK